MVGRPGYVALLLLHVNLMRTPRAARVQRAIQLIHGLIHTVWLDFINRMRHLTHA